MNEVGRRSRRSELAAAPPAAALVLYAVIWLNFYDQLAFLPILSPRAEALGATAFGIGAIVAIYSVTSAAGNGVAGPLLDRLGRWPFIAGSFAVMAATAALHAVATRPETLLAVRAAHGLAGGAVMPAAFALLGDLGGRRSQGRRMGTAGGAIALAAVIAPPVNGAIADRVGFGGAALAVSALLVLGAAGAALALPRLERAAGGPDRDPRARELALAPVPWRPLLTPYAAAFGLMFGQGVLFYALPLKAQAAGLSAAATGILFTAFAAGALVAFATPLARLGDRFGRPVPTSAGLGLAAASHLALAYAVRLPPLVAVMVVLGLGFGLVFSSLGAWVTELTTQGSRGRAFGVYYAVFSLGAIAGAVAAGAAEPLGSPFFAAAAVIGLGLARAGARAVRARAP